MLLLCVHSGVRDPRLCVETRWKLPLTTLFSHFFFLMSLLGAVLSKLSSRRELAVFALALFCVPSAVSAGGSEHEHVYSSQCCWDYYIKVIQLLLEKVI